MNVWDILLLALLAAAVLSAVLSLRRARRGGGCGCGCAGCTRACDKRGSEAEKRDREP